MIPNGVVNQEGAFVRAAAASAFIANGQNPAKNVVTKAAIRWGEWRMIVPRLQKTVVELNHLRVKSVKTQKKTVKMSAAASMWQPSGPQTCIHWVAPRGPGCRASAIHNVFHKPRIS